jgi:regulator of protease activity HflC (stomatin/prohibitin superfamily)
MTIEVVSVHRALFRVEHWLEETQNQIVAAIRQYVGTKKFDELIKNSAVGAAQLYKALTEGITDSTDIIVEEGILQTILRRWGVRVVKLQINSIDADSAFKKMVLKAFEGKSEADRINALYGAIERFGETGKLMAILEALPNTGANVFLGLDGDMAKLISSLGARTQSQSQPATQGATTALPAPAPTT